MMLMRTFMRYMMSFKTPRAEICSNEQCFGQVSYKNRGRSRKLRKRTASDRAKKVIPCQLRNFLYGNKLLKSKKRVSSGIFHLHFSRWRKRSLQLQWKQSRSENLQGRSSKKTTFHLMNLFFGILTQGNQHSSPSISVLDNDSFLRAFNVLHHL